MKKHWKEKLDGLKLNKKFTLVICFLVILPISIMAGVLTAGIIMALGSSTVIGALSLI